MALAPGTLLRGRYDVLRNANHGGMSTVFEAIDKRLADSRCAVKELLDTTAAGPAADYLRSTFELEMKALVDLDHPCIPKVRDFFHEDGKSYIVMEYLPGRNLQQELQEHLELSQRAFPAGKAVADILAVLEIVAYLHGQTPSIVHRDIKPANIIRDEKSGRLKLVDFGLARTLLDKSTLPSRVGTLGYCAPEQLAGCADLRSDIYSVGATLHFLMTGQPPRLGADIGRSQIPPELYPIVARATAPRASERYGTVRELIADLQAWQDGTRATSLERGVARIAAPLTPRAKTLAPRQSGRTAWVFLATMALGMGWVGGQVFFKTAPRPALVETWNPPTETVLTSLGIEPMRPYEPVPARRHSLPRPVGLKGSSHVTQNAPQPSQVWGAGPTRSLRPVYAAPALTLRPTHRLASAPRRTQSKAEVTATMPAPSLGAEAYPRSQSVPLPLKPAVAPVAQRPAIEIAPAAPSMEASVSRAREANAPAVAVSVEASGKGQQTERSGERISEAPSRSEYPGQGGPAGGGPLMGVPGGGPGGRH